MSQHAIHPTPSYQLYRETFVSNGQAESRTKTYVVNYLNNYSIMNNGEEKILDHE